VDIATDIHLCPHFSYFLISFTEKRIVRSPLENSGRFDFCFISEQNIMALVAFLLNGSKLHQADETQAGIKRIPLRMSNSLTGRFYCALLRLFLAISTPMNRLLLISLLLIMAGRAFGDRAFDYYISGINREDRGDLDGALADYTKAIELKPDHAFAYNNRGVVKKAKGDLDGALADETRAIELSPNLPEAWYNRGFVKHARGDLDGALADETRAIELKPDFAQAWYNRGLVEHAKSNLDGALLDYTKAIEFKPDYAIAYNSRGDAKHTKGDLEGALADFNKAIEIKPGLSQAWYGCGVVKQAKGDAEGALAAYTQAIELDPKAATVYHSRGCLRYDNHQFADALADFRKAIELDDSLDYSHFRLWLARARVGEIKPATKELRGYLASRKTGRPNDWEATVMRFLSGQISDDTFFKATVNNDKTKEAGQECEAYFYAGSKRLIEGGKTTAAIYFQKCVETGKKDFMEYKSAAAELKFLRGTP